MKKIVFIFSAVILTSCNKYWSCTLTNNGVESSSSYHFYGTNEEKNAHEQSNTNTFEVGGQTYVQETNCVPD